MICVRRLKWMLRVFFSLSRCLRFPSIKIVHNDTKASRRRHIQLRQPFPSLACKNKHRQNGTDLWRAPTYTHTSNWQRCDRQRFSLRDIWPNRSALCFSPNRSDPKRKCCDVCATYCILFADSFVWKRAIFVCSQLPLNANKSNFVDSSTSLRASNGRQADVGTHIRFCLWCTNEWQSPILEHVQTHLLLVLLRSNRTWLAIHAHVFPKNKIKFGGDALGLSPQMSFCV